MPAAPSPELYAIWYRNRDVLPPFDRFVQERQQYHRSDTVACVRCGESSPITVWREATVLVEEFTLPPSQKTFQTRRCRCGGTTTLVMKGEKNA